MLFVSKPLFLTETFNSIYYHCFVVWLFTKIKNNDATPFATNVNISRASPNYHIFFS